MPAGQELTIGYVELYAPRPERRRQLEGSKGFVCECSRCSVPDAPGERRLGGGNPTGAEVRAAIDGRAGWDSGLALYQAGELRQAKDKLDAVLSVHAATLGQEHWVIVDIHKLLLDAWSAYPYAPVCHEVHLLTPVHCRLLQPRVG